MPLKKHSPGCNCCPSEMTCEGFAECLGIVCVPPPCRMTRSLEIEIQGFSNGLGWCTDCDFANHTYLFPPGFFSRGPAIRCQIVFDDFGFHGTALCNLTLRTFLHFELKRNVLGVFDLLINLNTGGGPVAADYYHPNVFETDVLCSGGAITVPSTTAPYTVPQGFQGCDYNGAPAIVRFL